MNFFINTLVFFIQFNLKKKKIKKKKNKKKNKNNIN